MATRARHFCYEPGCRVLTCDTYCDKHAPLHAERVDYRVSSTERGYDYPWQKFSKHYLAMPEHQFCVLHISARCKGRATCVDHIHPLTGPDDPRKYDPANLQAVCGPCNTLKGKQVIYGCYVYGKEENE